MAHDICHLGVASVALEGEASINQEGYATDFTVLSASRYVSMALALSSGVISAYSLISCLYKVTGYPRRSSKIVHTYRGG